MFTTLKFGDVMYSRWVTKTPSLRHLQIWLIHKYEMLQLEIDLVQHSVIW